MCRGPRGRWLAPPTGRSDGPIAAGTSSGQEFHPPIEPPAPGGNLGQRLRLGMDYVSIGPCPRALRGSSAVTRGMAPLGRSCRRSDVGGCHVEAA